MTALPRRAAAAARRVAGRERRRLAALAHLWALRASGRRGAVVLMYHRVEPQGGDVRTELAAALSLGSFVAHVRLLRRHYRVVPAATILTEALARRRGRRFPVAITFDDDTPSHVRHAGPLLARHGLAATFFLNGRSLDKPNRYWWERLQAGRDAGHALEELLPEPVHAAARDAGGDAFAISEAVERLPTAERDALSEQLRHLIGEDPADSGLRSDQVRMLSGQGFDIGFHGENHHPLSLLPVEQLGAELDGNARRRLSEIAGTPLDLIAYPHGKVNDGVASAARRGGFRLGFTVRQEPVTAASDPLLLGRIDVRAMTGEELARRLVHVLAAARGGA